MSKRKMNEFEAWAIVGPDTANEKKVWPVLGYVEIEGVKIKFSLISQNVQSISDAQILIKAAQLKAAQRGESDVKDFRIARVRVTEI